MGYCVQYFLLTFRDIGYSRKLIMGILASFKGLLACLLQGIWDIGTPTPLHKPLLISSLPGKALRMHVESRGYAKQFNRIQHVFMKQI